MSDQVNLKSGKVRTGQFEDRSRHVKVKFNVIRSVWDKVRSGLSMPGQFRSVKGQVRTSQVRSGQVRSV